MSTSFSNHGLQDLTTEECDPIVDIVFVHGLHGSKEATWTAEVKNEKILWPRDLLQQDIKEARILTWGYDSYIAHFWTKSSVGNVDTHAKNLCADLSSLRENTNTTERPIILVAHSLGGIVCANALVLAESSAEPYANEVAKFIRGILFLGTPLEGSSKTKWAKAGNNFVSLYKRTNSEHVAVIEENSIKLGDIGAAFLQLLRKRREAKEPGRKIEIVCFFEEQETAIGLIVKEASATLDSYEKSSIAADHRAMCKFATRDDPGYKRIEGFLRRWIDQLDDEEDMKLNQGGTVNIAKWTGGTNFGQQWGQGGRPVQNITFSGQLPTAG